MRSKIATFRCGKHLAHQKCLSNFLLSDMGKRKEYACPVKCPYIQWYDFHFIQINRFFNNSFALSYIDFTLTDNFKLYIYNKLWNLKFNKFNNFDF